MSRTFRRKKTSRNGYWHELEWYTSEHVRSANGWQLYTKPYPKDSKEYKAGLARFHSDGATHSCKEPGPGWFRNLYNTRPSRVGARNEIIKWLRNEEYEVVAETHPHLPYWT